LQFISDPGEDHSVVTVTTPLAQILKAQEAISADQPIIYTQPVFRSATPVITGSATPVTGSATPVTGSTQPVTGSAQPVTGSAQTVTRPAQPFMTGSAQLTATHAPPISAGTSPPPFEARRKVNLLSTGQPNRRLPPDAVNAEPRRRESRSMGSTTHHLARSGTSAHAQKGRAYKHRDSIAVTKLHREEQEQLLHLQEVHRQRVGHSLSSYGILHQTKAF
jgi:hypothetical protein